MKTIKTYNEKTNENIVPKMFLKATATGSVVKNKAITMAYFKFSNTLRM